MLDLSNEPLDQSIRHWKYIAMGMAGSAGYHNSPLCNAYNGDCEGCPVAYTRHTHVVCPTLEPYWKSLSMSSAPTQDHTYKGYTARTPQAKKAAWAMVAFLQSLKK